jgi:hypothetical protein
MSLHRLVHLPLISAIISVVLTSSSSSSCAAPAAPVGTCDGDVGRGPNRPLDFAEKMCHLRHGCQLLIAILLSREWTVGHTVKSLIRVTIHGQARNASDHHTSDYTTIQLYVAAPIGAATAATRRYEHQECIWLGWQCQQGVDSVGNSGNYGHQQDVSNHRPMTMIGGNPSITHCCEYSSSVAWNDSSVTDGQLPRRHSRMPPWSPAAT